MLCKAELIAIVCRRDADDAAERAVERDVVGKPDVQADIADAVVRIQQQLLCLRDAHIRQIVRKRHAGLAAEELAEIRRKSTKKWQENSRIC